MASGTLSNNNVDVSNNNPTLSWGKRAVVGTVNGQELSVNMPANPDTRVTVLDSVTSTRTDAALSAYRGKLLNDQFWNVTNQATSGGFYYYKYGRVCFAVLAEGTLGNAVNSGGTLATIPVGFRPIRVCPAPAYAWVNGVGDVACRVHFNASGTVGLQGGNNLPAGAALRVFACYVTYD